MKSSLFVLVAAACAGTSVSSPVRNGAPPPAVAPEVEDPIEAQIPGDAVAVMYQASGSFLPIDCQGLRRLGASFEVVLPGGRQLTLYAGDFPRPEVTKCFLDYVAPGDPAAKVNDEGDTTTITSQLGTFTFRWHAHYMTLAMSEAGAAAPASPSPSADKIAAFHALRSAKVAVWSRVPFMKVLTGFDAPELTVLLDAWDMPAEWHRKVSGTITARFASAADARAAAAQIATGQLATVTDPALIAVVKGLKVEVTDATLRATVTDFTFDPRELEKQLAPVLDQAK